VLVFTKTILQAFLKTKCLEDANYSALKNRRSSSCSKLL